MSRDNVKNFLRGIAIAVVTAFFTVPFIAFAFNFWQGWFR